MKFRRRTYLIDSGFQIKLILTFLIISLIGSLLVVVVFNTLALKELETQIWSVHISAQSTGEILRPLFFKANLASMALISALLIAGVMVVNRKTSGPLYRMSRDIRKIADGNLGTTVSLREKDEFQNVAETLNTMAGKLRSDFASIADAYYDISERLAGLGTPDAKGEASSKDYDTLLKNISDLESQLNKFQTEKTVIH